MPPTQQVMHLIENRRSIFPKMFNDELISDQEIWSILEAANWAPSHRKTEPWRFQVFRDQAKNRLATYLQEYYKSNTPEEKFSAAKFDKIAKKAIKSQAIIAIIMHRDPQERVPEWEELAATAMAVQNMWLQATAMGIGGYWSSPQSAVDGSAFFGLAENEQCLGIFYLGKYEKREMVSTRGSMEEKVIWKTD